jgi:CBS domain-containing protein
MKTIGQLLESKGKDIWSIAPGESVYEALRIMSRKDVGAVLVIDKEKLVGIFSERDYARKIILEGKSSKDTAVGELMTKDVYYVEPKNTLHETLAVMTSRGIRHMPVMDKEQLVGIVTIIDVGNQVVADQEFTIRELEKYISGSYDRYS